MEESRPIRVLHVLGGLNRGGVETWLVQALRNIDRSKYQMDFLVHATEPCPYDDEVRALGSKIIPCPGHRNPLLYGRRFLRILDQHGPYDVVHSHVHFFSGFVLFLARLAKIPARIAHSHNSFTVLALVRKQRLSRRLYGYLMQAAIKRFATCGLACSEEAGRVLYGACWGEDKRFHLHYCGIELSPFRELLDRSTVRRELGLPEAAFVMGHVGRFAEEKNHSFLIDVAEELFKHNPDACLLLVGDGPLRPEIEEKISERQLNNRIILLGLRSDVPRVMMGAMDVFVLTSPREGVPLVGSEAQAAGLPCIVAETVSEEMDVVKQLIHRLSLSEPASRWAESILQAKASCAEISQQDALHAVEESHLNIEKSIVQLQSFYSSSGN